MQPKDLARVQRVDFIKDATRGRKVLHLGCTNWPFTELAIEHKILLHLDLKETASELWGFDYDQEGIDLLSSRGVDRLYRADLEKLDEVEIDEKFDVIIAGEMIEHLSNPGLFLKGIQRFMHDETDLVVTTINAYGALRFVLYALRGKGGMNEPVHEDHVAYYSYSTLKLVIERAGLAVTNFCFYDMGNEHRKFARFIYRLINDVSVKLFPQLCDGVIAVCRLKKNV